MNELADVLARPVLQVAPRLLGALLRHETVDGAVTVRLTEVEAYAGQLDPGSHAYRGLTPRTAVMFGPAGHLYVYFTYGMHWCANVVTGPDGLASAVLLRAGEVVDGLDLARVRRPACKADRDLARGPARLASTLGLTGEQNGIALADGLNHPGPLAPPGATSTGVMPPNAMPRDATATNAAPTRAALQLRSRGHARSGIRTGPRVGVSGAGGDASAHPWRFWLEGDPTVSVYRPGKPRR